MGSIYKRDENEKRWTIQWTDQNGRTRRKRVKGDKDCARSVLSNEERRVARGEAGLLDPFEETKVTKLATLADTYVRSLGGEKRAPRYVRGVADRLALAFEVMAARFVQDVTVQKVETFLTRLLTGDNMPPMKPRKKGGNPIPRGAVSATTRDRR